MGKGIDLTKLDAPEHMAVLDNFKDRLLLAIVHQAGGKLAISVADIDATGGHVLAFSIRDDVFHFEVRAKQ